MDLGNRRFAHDRFKCARYMLKRRVDTLPCRRRCRHPKQFPQPTRTDYIRRSSRRYCCCSQRRQHTCRHPTGVLSAIECVGGSLLAKCPACRVGGKCITILVAEDWSMDEYDDCFGDLEDGADAEYHVNIGAEVDSIQEAVCQDGVDTKSGQAEGRHHGGSGDNGDQGKGCGASGCVAGSGDSQQGGQDHDGDKQVGFDKGGTVCLPVFEQMLAGYDSAMVIASWTFDAMSQERKATKSAVAASSFLFGKKQDTTIPRFAISVDDNAENEDEDEDENDDDDDGTRRADDGFPHSVTAHVAVCVAHPGKYRDSERCMPVAQTLTS